jgi:hypothetical protein
MLSVSSDILRCAAKRSVGESLRSQLSGGSAWPLSLRMVR